LKRVFLCSLSNISSGNCSEDCKFCVQNSARKTNIARYKQKNISVIVEEAKKAEQNMANGFCLVTAGLALTSTTKKYLLKIIDAVKKETNIKIIACNGIASKKDLKDLKSAGVHAYNHNLECQKDFYSQICTTHPWQDRYKTCENVNEAGLVLICGGIFGIGETKQQRELFLNEIKPLAPKKIPLNFYIPNKNLDLPVKIMKKEEAIEIIAKAREIFPKEKIMLAGGRELVFGDDWLEGIKAGANSIIIDGYLTSGGAGAKKDIDKLKSAGYAIG